MRSMRRLVSCLVSLSVLLSGCGHNGASAPAAISYVDATAVYLIGVPITPNSPLGGGGATSYSVSPALPAGLSLNAGTGIVNGTPSAVTAKASYTVTASGPGGSTTTTLTITVNDQPPTQFSYAAGTATYTVNATITENDPTNMGGAITSFSVSPALPAGVSLSTTTGDITGTPTAVTPLAKYTVTATNTGGIATAVLTITISPASTAPLAAPAGLAYKPGNATYTAGIAIPANVPNSTGGVPLPYTDPSGNPIPAYSISPALPQGMWIDGTELVPLGDLPTGIISGTPAAASPKTTYTVTANNPAGSTTATLTIEVLAADAAPAGLAYTTSAPVYAAGTKITPDIPVISALGGAPTNYSVSPDLSPTGLTLDSASGVLSGTPVALASTTAPPLTFTYTVTASNSAGTVTAPLTITVYNAHQSVPNMAQAIDPLAAPGSTFQFLDTGMTVTDTYDPNVPSVEWMAGQAVSTAVNPNLKLLAVLTSGFNRVFHEAFPFFDPLYSNEYVFIYDISTGTPRFKQAIPIPNAYHGLAWDPVQGRNALYVSGGMGDEPFGTDPIPYPANAIPNGDNVHIITLQANGLWAPAAELDLGPTNSVVSGHKAGNGLPVPDNQLASVNSAVYVAPMAAGLAVSSDGQTLVVANYYNDSITVFTGGLSVWLDQWQPDATSLEQGQGVLAGAELDLRPGMAASSPAHGIPGGEYPFWVVLSPSNPVSGVTENAYVSSLRDREIDVVSLEACAHGTTGPGCYLQANPVVTARIPVKGQPNKMAINKAGTLLYVAEDESDTVDVIDLNPRDVGVPSQNQPARVNTVIETIPVIAPPSVMAGSPLAQHTGANTNSVTLSPDEKYLYVTNGNLNNIAVVKLTGTNTGDQVIGLIPTGWYPNSVAVSPDGAWAYVATSKSPTGPNPNWCYVYGPAGYPTCMPANEYNPQLTKAGLQAIPLAPTLAQSELETLTGEVTDDNHFSNVESAEAASTMAAVHSGVQHVIYILKENRTYDQILGDLGRGNGDPALTLFGQAITPNEHNLAQQFVTLDNFLATAEVSNDGWPWSTSARAPDVVEHQYPINYAQRGLSLDTEGMNRNVNVAIPTLAQRQASDPLMPGGALSPNVTGGEDLLPGQADVDAPDGPDDELNTGYLWDDVLRAGLTVRDYGFFVDTNCYNEPRCQVPLAHDPFSTKTIVAPPTNVALTPFTDQYFRGFDPAFPDYYRFKEWERDFDTNYATGGLPNLTLIRFMHDHTGSFGTAIDKVNTPERDVADNDYAVGLVVQKIANNPLYKDNTLIFVVEDDAQDGGDHMDSHRTTAYVAGAYVKNAVVSTAYTTLNFMRTMEEVLDLPPMNLNDALAAPMSDIFNTSPSPWTFTATPAAILYCTQLPLPASNMPCNDPTPDVKYWTRVTRGMDFNDADLVDGATFNHVLWKGMMGSKPYPSHPSGKDLRQNRDNLLANYRQSLRPKGVAKTAGE